MFSQYLSSIDNVWIFPIITLILFFSMFSGILFWVLNKDKSYMENLANIPLQDNNEVELKDESKNEK
jgi:cytochrome c oxidase cbb3-type subunit IV